MSHHTHVNHATQTYHVAVTFTKAAFAYADMVAIDRDGRRRAFKALARAELADVLGTIMDEWDRRNPKTIVEEIHDAALILHEAEKR